MKLCKDCAYHVTSVSLDPDQARCAHPDAVKRVHPVDGEPRVALCVVERASYCANDCGPDAKHFEPKPAAAAE